MCGIVGQVNRDRAPVDRALLERMCVALEHRGPDSRGIHAEDGAGLGIQRLRIIDLATGDQPIWNEDRSVVVVHNGEIYNFRELRTELQQRGHSFRTGSDSEVIVHLYEEHGLDFVSHLHGMFGLAIWDRRRRRLVLARDRAGKKPLFYAERGGVLSFASELGALLADREIPREVDYQALDAYFAYRYVPSPRTAFRNVCKLPPATMLVHEQGKTSTTRYWTLDFSAKHPGRHPEEVAEELRERIGTAVRRRMVSDVPLGAFLSGGVDSSAVVAAMAEASPQPVKTFSIGFGDPELDELDLARLMADRYSTEHHELVVEPHAVDVLPKIVSHHAEPFADATSIPTFYLAKLAREHVTVALNGDGGDELFAGYSRYAANKAAAAADALPLWLRRAARRAALLVPASPRLNSTRSRVRRLGDTLPATQLERYQRYMTDLQGFDRARLYTRQFDDLIGSSIVPEVLGEPWRASTAVDLVDRMLDVDRLTYLADDLLSKVDIATMACSLEGRSPLLDHELMEFAASLPADMKIRGAQKKVVLRAAMRGRVPDEILDAPKRGFQPPLATWLRGELNEMAQDVLLDATARARAVFDPHEVKGLLDRHLAGRQDNSLAIWTLIMSELWHREFIDGPSTRTASEGASIGTVGI